MWFQPEVKKRAISMSLISSAPQRSTLGLHSPENYEPRAPEQDARRASRLAGNSATASSPATAASRIRSFPMGRQRFTNDESRKSMLSPKVNASLKLILGILNRARL